MKRFLLGFLGTTCLLGQAVPLPHAFHDTLQKVSPDIRAAPSFLTLSEEGFRKSQWTWKGTGSFLGGALVGFLIHEGAHLAVDLALDSKPYFKRVDAGSIPFFALSYQRQMTPRQDYAITSAGFIAQHTMAERILDQYPNLWTQDAPAAKGAFVFHLITCLIYTHAALTSSGPLERDSLTMAYSARIDEKWIGAALFCTAALDLYRSFHPEARWATWTSRGIKISFLFGFTR